jgi:hypothetical protein
MTMKRRTILMSAAVFPWLGACAGVNSQTEGINVRGIGVVVEYQLAPDDAVKEGVNAIADTGYQLFGPSRLSETNGGIIPGLSHQNS